ncbi:hypothetical protein [Methanosphaera sp.]|uniref:hypothetical protein n=1 Tax=Methanosphaera sp. TaxID=2666342 RepID=UPI0025D9494F|nr:hypothetical protein [Methanosphaera sp.]
MYSVPSTLTPVTSTVTVLFFRTLTLSDNFILMFCDCFASIGVVFSTSSIRELV